MTIGKEDINPRNFIVSDDNPAPVRKVDKKRRNIIVGGIAAFVLAIGGSVGYVAVRDDEPTKVEVVWTVSNSNPIKAKANTPYTFGDRVEVEPVSDVKGFYVTALPSGIVRFENQSDQAVSIADILFKYTMPDGTTGGGLGSDHWGTVLQPDEKFDSELDLPYGATLNMVISDGTSLRTVVSWQP